MYGRVGSYRRNRGYLFCFMARPQIWDRANYIPSLVRLCQCLIWLAEEQPGYCGHCLQPPPHNGTTMPAMLLSSQLHTNISLSIRKTSVNKGCHDQKASATTCQLRHNDGRRQKKLDKSFPILEVICISVWWQYLYEYILWLFQLVDLLLRL